MRAICYCEVLRVKRSCDGDTLASIPTKPFPYIKSSTDSVVELGSNVSA